MAARASFKSLSLYTSPFSGCSARVRITGHLKSIPLTYTNIAISKSQQSTPDYLAINPNASVPSLVVEKESQPPFIITQSPAILDFLESHFPTPPLLPPVEKFQDRARVMELASLVVCDIQPPQNSRVRKTIVSKFGGDGEEWARYVYNRGFDVYERFLERGVKGRYSVGDEITLADVCLVPAAQGGLRVGIELGKWPLMRGVVEECWKLEAFGKGGLGGHERLVP
jgi:maleylacetoacetate isomerase